MAEERKARVISTVNPFNFQEYIAGRVRGIREIAEYPWRKENIDAGNILVFFECAPL